MTGASVAMRPVSFSGDTTKSIFFIICTYSNNHLMEVFIAIVHPFFLLLLRLDNCSFLSQC